MSDPDRRFDERAGPRRPRLGEHVAVRRHIIDGSEVVVAHDRRSGASARLGGREWGVLRCADGTRDRPGLLAAATLRGYRIGRADLDSFLGELDRAGMLADGLPPEAPAPEVDPRPHASVDPLRGFSLHCDGRGTCCRSYPTTMLTPEEAARAAALRPVALARGWDPERAFTPELGSSFGLPLGRERARCVTMVEGRCAYLARDDRCELHAAGGPGAKPLGCRQFPAVLTDDGEAIRVAPAPECACVLRSVGLADGEPLVAATASTGAGLEPGTFVRRLSAEVRLAGEGGVPLADYRGWWRAECERWARAWGDSQPAPDASVTATMPADVPATLWRLAASLETDGLAHGHGWRAAWQAPAVPPDELSPWLQALAGTIDARLAEWSLWRSRHDLVPHLARAVRAAAERLMTDSSAVEAVPAAAIRRAEVFTVHTRLHAHGYADELPLATALRDQAVRLLLARALPETLRGPASALAGDAAIDEPIALVEALLRGQGLWSYAERAAGA
jgi:lysine-N-methylase